MLDQVDEILPPIIKRLEDAMAEALGEKWAQRWDEDLPRWDENPGEINMHVALRMRNLAVAYDMIEYAKNRYNMLGSGGAFFPGQKPADFDEQIIAELVKDSPLADQIPGALAEAHALLNGEQGKRLAQD